MIDPAGAPAEKLPLAERQFAGLRLLVVLSGTLLYPFFIPRAGTIPWLAYSLLALAWVYGLYVYLAEPYRRHPALESSYAITAADAAFTMLWLHATGGVDSPFYVAMYLAVAGTAYRFSLPAAVGSAAIYSAGYLALLLVHGRTTGHPSDIAVRLVYVFFCAMLGSILAQQVARHAAERVRYQERLRTEERHLTASRQTQQELAQKGELLTEANRQLEEAARFKDDFLSMIGHDLRTPLTAIVGSVSLLEDSVPPLPPCQSRFVAIIREASERMLALVDELLDLARIRAGQLWIAQREIELRPILDALVETLEPLARRAGVQLGCACDRETTAWADEGRLYQVVANLVSNAVKFTPAGGRVDIEATEEDGDVFVRVRDTGLGIASDDIPKLFDQFVQLGRGAEQPRQGTGLGLAICKAIVEAHGGRIGVHSQPGAGSTFWIALGRRQANDEGGRSARETLETSAPVARSVFGDSRSRESSGE